MKIVIEIPEKTNAHIRSDYGHGMKCLFDKDVEILCDAIYHCLPYEEIPHGEWIYNQYDGNLKIGNWHCSECRYIVFGGYNQKPYFNFCPNCGADMREGDEND